MDTHRQNLLFLFDRPNEPIFLAKGSTGNIKFDCPSEYLKDISDEYEEIYENCSEHLSPNLESCKTIHVKKIDIPDLHGPLSVGREEHYSSFIPKHQHAAAQLIDLFLGMESTEDLESLAAYCRDRMNPQMFVYALSVAILHRKDTKDLVLPTVCEMFPDKFIDGSAFSRAKKRAKVAKAGSKFKNPIEIPRNFTASDVDAEHRVAYFREDIGISSHHWHWHLVYPFSASEEIVNKDRRGELFYYMHHQILARYNIERLCNRLSKTRPLSLREKIPEAYFPKLNHSIANKTWPARPENMVPSDINRNEKDKVIAVSIDNMEMYRDRILEAIRKKVVINADGDHVILDEKTGIDILGNMVEASVLSPNKNYYGDLHNSGHLLLSYIHDPDYRYLEPITMMGDEATAMRDPVFYRWHAYIDGLFAEFKDNLTPYSPQQLSFPGVTISDVNISTPGFDQNTLNTHWNKSDIEMSGGLDFTSRNSILVRLQHLNHHSFSYNISINCSLFNEVTGTVRIFMAPKYDEKGRDILLNDQRKLMIEMDKFTVQLKNGDNFITRRSDESAVTIPFEATFRDLDKSNPQTPESNLCGCGWPQHMLVPKGDKKGYPMVLFVMISNYEFDKVIQDYEKCPSCKNAVSFCGLADLKYPDAQAMGFPFDRDIPSTDNFYHSNMVLEEIIVKFEDVVKERFSNEV